MIKVAWDRATRGNVLRAFSASIFIGTACLAFAADGGTNITLSGWVIDSACAYTKGLDKPIGVACATRAHQTPTGRPPQQNEPPVGGSSPAILLLTTCGQNGGAQLQPDPTYRFPVASGCSAPASSG
jgi:hypothetical protein